MDEGLYFLHLGSREAIDITLHRFTRSCTIRRLARGVYDYPKEHPVLGPLQPSAETVALASDDATLRRLISVWPELPENTKRAINAIGVDALLFDV